MAEAIGGAYSEAGTKAFVNALIRVLTAGDNITIISKEMGGKLQISSDGAKVKTFEKAQEAAAQTFSAANPTWLVLVEA